MSEDLSVTNLVLGIIGTVTGVIALFVSYWMYRKENPRLITIEKCKHDFTLSESQVKTITFWVTFLVKNHGDRGTRINDVDLFFSNNAKEYRLEKKYFREVEENGLWLEAHDTATVEPDFLIVMKV